MCGRYYVDDETAREIEKLVRQVDEKLRMERRRRDVNPTQSSLILLSKENGIQAEELTWGFPGYKRKGVIFNARSESALEKKMFRESVLQRRCIIPAKGFYEWDSGKNKVAFQRENGETMFMAGFYKQFEDALRYVILTTDANTSVSDVHDRMPLVLERNEVKDWLCREDKVVELLRKMPTMLIRIGDYQQSMF